MDFYESSSYYPVDENSYYYPQMQTPYYYESDHTGYYPYSYSYSDSYNYPQPQPSCGYYEYLPANSLVAYDPVASTQCVVYHSVAAPSPATATATATAPPEPDLDEYEKHPYRGGYDIAQTYGKPLPPTDLICYPPSSSLPSPSLPSLPSLPPPSISLPSPSPVAAIAAPPTPAQELDDDEEEEDEEEDEDEDEPDEEEDPDPVENQAIQVYGGGECDVDGGREGNENHPHGPDEEADDDDDCQEEEPAPIEHQAIQVYDGRAGIQNQPHGYGLEAFDLCENLFGYWPCLARSKNNCYACGRPIPRGGADVDQWRRRTADYLFGNPDPYRGWEDEAGYATENRVSAYHQMHYQQPSLTLYEQQQQPSLTLYEQHPTLTLYEQQQPHGYAQNSWFP